MSSDRGFAWFIVYRDDLSMKSKAGGQGESCVTIALI